MKKPLIAFVVLFALAFGLFMTGEMNKLDTNAAIAKAPGFIVATPEGITKRTKKGNDSYKLDYAYTVDSVKYTIETDYMSTEAEAMAMADKPVEVAYAKDAPGKRMFKTEFDARDPKAGMGSAMLSAAGFGLLLSIIGTLVLLWKFPWFRSA